MTGIKIMLFNFIATEEKNVSIDLYSWNLYYTRDAMKRLIHLF